MGKWIDQLIGAGRGDENPAADRAYRNSAVANRNKEATKARMEKLAAEQTGEGNGGNKPGNVITNGF